MNVLVFANTPDQVHAYRNFVMEMRARGHVVELIVRDYTCTLDIATYYDLPHRVYGTHDTGDYSLVDFSRELPSQLARIAIAVREFKPDVVFGRGPYAAFAGTIGNAKTVLLVDSQPGYRPIRVATHFADLVLSPSACTASFGEKHRTFDGFIECAYLHPNVYTPTKGVRELLGLDGKPVAVVRLGSFDALHDRAYGGLDDQERRSLLDRLSRNYTVILLDESGEVDASEFGIQTYDLHPAEIHDLLAEASLLVAETGTMVIEAALLGTPVIACGPHVADDFGEYVWLKERSLVSSSTDLSVVLARARKIRRKGAEEDLPERQTIMSDMVDLTQLLVDVSTEAADDFELEENHVRPK